MAFSPTLDETIGQGLVAAEKSLKFLQVTYIAMGVLVIAIDVTLVFAQPRLVAVFIPLFVFGAFMALLGGFSRQFMRFVQKPFLTGPENMNLFVARRIIANEKTLRIEWDNGIVHEFPWQTLPKARVLKSTLYIAVSKQQFIVIPERAYPEKQGWHSLMSLCAKKVADNNLRPSLK